MIAVGQALDVREVEEDEPVGSPSPAARPLGPLVAVFGAVATAAALVLAARAGWPDGRVAAVAYTVTVATWLGPGALVAARRPRLLFGWLLLAGGMFLAAGMLATAYGDAAAAGDRLPAAGWAAWIGGFVFFPHLGAYAAIYLLVPSGSLLSRRWRAAVHLLVVVNVATVVLAALGPVAARTGGRIARLYANPLGGIAWANAAFPAAVVGQNLVFVIALVAVWIRWRRAEGDDRRLLRLLFALAVVDQIVGLLLISPPGNWVYALAVPSTMCVTVAVAVGVLRYRLWDLRVVLSRALTYLVLTGLVVVLFAGTVVVASLLFTSGAGPTGVVLGAAFAAVAVAPAQRRVQRAVDHLVYGRRHDPYAVLSTLGTELEAAVDPAEALERLVVNVAASLKLPYAAVELDSRTGIPVVAAAHGAPGERILRLPLRHQGRPLGALALGLRPGDPDFSAADRSLLADLARQAGAAVHAVALTTALRQSRERLVTAREEERRRLRRDLHDGLASALTAVGLKADAAAELVQRGDGRAAVVLDGLRGDVAETLGEVRRLVSDLRPPALDDLGLAGALAHLASRSSTSSLAITAAGPQAGRLPAAVEVAVYRIVAEAVQNVARHSRARSCLVHAAADDRLLRVMIVDDGIGIDGAGRSGGGLGLASMAERAEEVGGWCRAERRPEGGTAVVAEIPVEPAG